MEAALGGYFLRNYPIKNVSGKNGKFLHPAGKNKAQRLKVSKKRGVRWQTAF